jgi:hypothetical protein
LSYLATTSILRARNTWTFSGARTSTGVPRRQSWPVDFSAKALWLL